MRILCILKRMSDAAPQDGAAVIDDNEADKYLCKKKLEYLMTGGKHTCCV